LGRTGNKNVQRRNFMRTVGSGAIALALTVGAQPNRMSRVGVLSSLAESDPEAKAYSAAFLNGLQDSGWIVGRNLQVDFRWTGGDIGRARRYAAELVAIAPDVILAAGG